MAELECSPYAVGHADEGVCLLVQMGPHRILLDCGLEDLSPLLRGPDGAVPADLVFCSHAHSDHAHGLLDLHQAFPNLAIYASEVTASLLPLNWLSQDVPQFCQSLPWRSPVQVAEDLTLQIWPSGHLPGAASILLTYSGGQRTYTVFYTGDFLLSNSRLVEGLPLDELRGLNPDVLIVEGTYGTARHPRRRQQENALADKINQAIAQGQSILLPSPTLGLGQELLMLLRSHHHFTGRDINIWVDGTVALGCDAYLNLLPYFPNTVQNFARHQPLFWDERIRPHVRQLPQGSELDRVALSANPDVPCIVLTDKKSNLRRYCRSDTGRWLLLLAQKPGQMSTVETAAYEKIQASPALQAQIQAGRLDIDSYLLGDHCDGSGTLQLIHNLRPQHVVFVHGSPTYLTDLTSLEELQNRYHLHLPTAETRIELTIGDTFIQPAPPETHYEGELTELKTTVLITMNKAIASDPRWKQFADTGLVEARWQGEDLVLRGLQQRELLNQADSMAPSTQVECCDNCSFYRGQRCWNQVSPLFGFKVTPEGYCPAFRSAYLPLESELDVSEQTDEMSRDR
ncbi:MAG: MBL fold metallo-hydrolase [Synechococcales bacterium]|nr:MBL fold metallo-hydrolase [Synechococcales bacterium]